MSLRLKHVPITKIFLELPSRDWIVLGVCLHSAPMVTLRLAFPRLPAVMVGTSAAGARLQVSAVLFVD